MEQKKVFSGSKPVLMQINNSIDRLKTIYSIIEESEKEPETYLINQLFNDYLEAQYILEKAFLSYGEYALEQFQVDYIQKVLTIFNSTFPQDDIVLETMIDDMGLYFIRVNTTFMEETIPILNIYPYFKTFEILPYNRLIELEETCGELKTELNVLQEKMDMLRKAYTHPAIYAGDDVKLFIKMNNKKKREEILNQELTTTTAEYQSIDEKLFEIQDEMNEINNTLLSVYIIRDRFIDRLKNRYQYISLVEEEQEINMDNNIENDSEIIENNKEFFSAMIEEDDSDIAKNFKFIE